MTKEIAILLGESIDMAFMHDEDEGEDSSYQNIKIKLKKRYLVFVCLNKQQSDRRGFIIRYVVLNKNFKTCTRRHAIIQK